MKPIHVGVLLLAGAIGGALVVKVMQKPAETPAPVAAQAPAPIPQPAAEPAPAEIAPVPDKKQAAKAERRPAPSRKKSEPVETAQNRPAPVPAPAVQAAPEPPKETPPPPPARTEPESVTPPPPPPPPPPRKVTLTAGTLIPVRLVDGLSSDRNMPGDTFMATLDQPLIAEGLVLAERGARVEGRVVSSDKGGKVKGLAVLGVELTRINTSDGQKVAIQTEGFNKEAESTKKQDAAKVGVGAAIGAAIGAIAGGGKGAAIGAGVGGGAGAGTVMLTRGEAATLPSETRISFRLAAPVTITERQKD